jgi:hypothetical protein
MRLSVKIQLSLGALACAAIFAGCAGDGPSDNAVGTVGSRAKPGGIAPAQKPLPWPQPGSGAAGVNAFDDWAANNLPKTIPGCSDKPPLTPTLYPWPIITTDGQFDLRFFKTERSGTKVTYFYDVVRMGKDLSHFDVSLRHILACLKPECSLQKIVTKIGAKIDPNGDGDPGDAKDVGVKGEVGTDPTTGITGVKWDNPPQIGPGQIMWLYFTLDESCIKSGFKLSENMFRCEPGVQGVVATKAGPQDIRRKDRQTPGYAYLPVPSCVPK